MKLKLKTTREDRQKIIVLLVCFSGVGLAALQSDTRNSTPFLAVVDRCLFGILGVSTRLIETVKYEKETMKSIIWLAFWNLGLIALSICVLAGCRTTAEKNYALVQWPRSTIGLIWGEECEKATADIIPDWYKFGASGVCRVTEDGTSCKRKFPPTFNLAQAVLQDLDKVESSSTLEKCKEEIDKPIDHKTPKTLGAVLVAFLITSIFINLFSVAIAAAEGHGWALWTSSILAVDMLLIFGSLILTVAMMNYEGGGYLVGVHGQEFSDREMMGIALWMLLAMLIGRLFSNPWLIILFVFILVTIIVVSLVLIRTRGFFYVIRTVVV